MTKKRNLTVIIVANSEEKKWVFRKLENKEESAAGDHVLWTGNHRLPPARFVKNQIIEVFLISASPVLKAVKMTGIILTTPTTVHVSTFCDWSGCVRTRHRFRCTWSTSWCFTALYFHQVEGAIKMCHSDLKALYISLSRWKVKTCLCPSYSPFTEPSAEVDAEHIEALSKLIMEYQSKPLVRNMVMECRSTNS
jgi:hypothetical protein